MADFLQARIFNAHKEADKGRGEGKENTLQAVRERKSPGGRRRRRKPRKGAREKE